MSDITIPLGVDQDHLENQWHLFLHQPATLAPDQTNNQPIESPASVHIASDPYAPALILLGIFLILMPLFGLGGLFTYQRRSYHVHEFLIRRKRLLNSTCHHIQRHLLRTRSHILILHVLYPAPYPYYPAYPPQALPDTPKVQDKMAYPADTYTGEKRWTGAPSPGQEYINRRPDKQAPQE